MTTAPWSTTTGLTSGVFEGELDTYAHASSRLAELS
jgi:hypothetical protein